MLLGPVSHNDYPPREQGGLTEVSSEHHGAAHRGRVRPESHPDRLLHQPFAQTDAQFPGDELRDVASFIRTCSFEQRGQPSRALSRDARIGDFGKRTVEVANRDRL